MNQNVMNPIVIRNLDDVVIQRLKQLAWQAGRSPEDMARQLLIDAVRARATRRETEKILEDARRLRVVAGALEESR